MMLLKYMIVVGMFSISMIILMIGLPILSSITLMINKFSSVMIIMSVLVWWFSVNSYSKLVHQPNAVYFAMLTFLMLAVLSFFSVINVFMFYVSFETSLIMILFIIVGWGYQVERIQASTYLLLYTVLGSFPLLIMFLFLSMVYQSPNINSFAGLLKLSSIGLILISLAFLVKFPIYFVHSWLPKAHVEAPTPGSIILAAILLKMGGYGIYRVSQITLSIKFNSLLASFIVLMGTILSTVVCIFQSDMKSLVAYSSVSHMTMMYWSMLAAFTISIKGSLLMMLSHGLTSSLLFLIAGSIFDIWKTRVILFIHGMLLTLPIMSGILFISMSMNFSVPPFLSVFSELMVISGIIYWNFSTWFIILLVIMLSCYYCISFYSMLSHGKPTSTPNLKHFHEMGYNLFFSWVLISLFMIFQLDVVT